MCCVDAACRILRITIFVFQKYFNKSRLNFILTAHITKNTLLWNKFITVWYIHAWTIYFFFMEWTAQKHFFLTKKNHWTKMRTTKTIKSGPIIIKIIKHYSNFHFHLFIIHVSIHYSWKTTKIGVKHQSMCKVNLSSFSQITKLKVLSKTKHLSIWQYFLNYKIKCYLYLHGLSTKR